MLSCAGLSVNPRQCWRACRLWPCGGHRAFWLGADTAAHVVQLLLGYLPPETALWPAVLAQKRAAYAQFCAELIVDPKSAAGDGGAVGRECGGGAAAPAADHPLSQSTDSKWHAFFKACGAPGPDRACCAASPQIG